MSRNDFIYSTDYDHRVYYNSTPNTDHKLNKCDKSSCITCRYTITDYSFDSTITNCKYFVSIKDTDFEGPMNCKTNNVIYLLQCNICKLQYIGETTQKLKDRFLQHRRNVTKGVKGYLYEHFRSNNHSIENMEILIIEKIALNEEQNVKHSLLEIENFWIRELNTAYPFGFNDRIKNYGDISNNINPVYHKNQPYFNHKTIRRPRERGARGLSRHRQLNDICNNILHSTNECKNFRALYIVLKSLTMTQLNKLTVLCTTNNIFSLKVKLAIQAFLASKFKSQQNTINKKVIIYNSALFVNKGLEKIQPEKILKYTFIKRLLPEIEQHKPQLRIAYRLNPPVSTKIFNYSKEIRDYQTNNAGLLNICECNHTNWLSQETPHVFSGDLKIIKNKKLGDMLAKGAKYREPKDIDFDLVKEELDKMIHGFAIKIATKAKISVDNLQEFINAFNNTVIHKINHFLPNSTPPYRSIWNDKSVTKELKRLQKLYIIAPADKAANNYVFICKKFYFKHLYNEFGINQNLTGINVLGNETYEFINKQERDIIDHHKRVVKKDPFHSTITSENSKLPIIFATPKLHKLPHVKFRFISGARNNTLKSVTNYLFLGLTYCKNFFQNYCNTIKSRIGIRCFWSINNNTKIIDFVNEHPIIQQAYSFDFSTLFTSLPHSVIKNELFYLVDLMFRNSNAGKYLGLSNHRSFFTNAPDNTHYKYFTDVEFKELIDIILNETYVKFGNLVFKQVKGIPMGGAASPLIADLTLSSLEFKFLKNPDNYNKAFKLRNTFRYIDDIIVFNIEQTEFLELAQTIYPTSLPLENSSGSNGICEYLDLKLQYGLKNSIEVFDKTQAFDFPVVKFIHSSSNVHTVTAKNVLISQLIRYARICTESKSFLALCQNLFSIYAKNGFSTDLVRESVVHFSTKHSYLLYKFRINLHQLFVNR